jgi:glutathione reductase (NADPH)
MRCGDKTTQRVSVMRNYDLVIVGTGVAASVAAYRARTAGWSVAVADHRPFGGTCALRGCDPKKVLMSGAETVDLGERMRRHGISGQVRIDWPSLVAFKREFTDPVPQARAESLAQAGIEAWHGTARFTAPDTIAIGDEILKARAVVLANGARPATLPIPGAEHLITSDAFMELERLPERILMVGGGYIAAEFSAIAARAGAKVIVLQREPQMLPQFDSDLVGWLTDSLAEIGIEIHTQAEVESVERSGRTFRVRARCGDHSATIEADLVVHAAGRVPDVGALDLNAGGVAADHGRLELNEFLQSVSNPRVYAAGDIAGKGPPLTPVASHEGEVVARNLLEGNRHRPDYRGVPSVAFTLPPIAAVGLSEQAARQQGARMQVRKQNATGWYSARRIAERVYGYKTLVEDETGRILGAHVVGPHADDLINVFALAIRHDLTADDLKRTIFAYPTVASDLSHML